MYSNIIGAIVTVIIAFLLIPKFKLYGAVVTALIGAITPMIVSLNFERRIMKLHIKNWVHWRKILTNIFITFLVSLPIFFLKDYISNIYLRTIVSGSLFVLFLIPLQIRFDIFIFKEQLFKLLNFIKLKI